MPQVFKVGSYWVYFWANENEPLEPVHVHVAQGAPTANATKIWITRAGKCYLCNNNSQIPPRVLRNIMAVIEARSGEVLEKWKAFSAKRVSTAERLISPIKSQSSAAFLRAAGLFCVFGPVCGGSAHRGKKRRCAALQYMQKARGTEPQNAPPESGE